MLAGARKALMAHWREYLMEGLELALFMVAAGFFTVLFGYRGSPAYAADPLAQRALVGGAMGLTAVGLIYSPLGRRSGGHFNPAVTLSFLRLGTISGWDALFYVLAQFMGGIAGVAMTAAALGPPFERFPVRYVVTVPGRAGASVAFAAELLLAFLLMGTVLGVGSRPRLARYTGAAAGTLVALFILLESPYSGMSINPARTVGSALPAGTWTGVWLYFAAPLLGMLLAAEGKIRLGAPGVHSAKLHDDHRHCLFRCGQHEGLPRT